MKITRIACFIACFIAWNYAIAQSDISDIRIKHLYDDLLVIGSHTALTGTWTCVPYATTCSGVGGDAQTELADGDIIFIPGSGNVDSYVVNGEPASANSITISNTHPVTGAELGMDGKIEAGTIYLINTGLTTTARTVYDGSGTASTFGVGTDEVEVGGGSGVPGVTSGSTLYDDGSAAFDGDVTVGGSVTVGYDMPIGTLNVAGELNLISTGNNAYSATLTTPTMTGNATYKLPTDEPGATYLLNMTSAGQMGYDSSTYLTAETDPQVGDVTLGNHCVGTGTQVSCTDTASYVPYTGASSDVDLGAYTLTTDYLVLDDNRTIDWASSATGSRLHSDAATYTEDGPLGTRALRTTHSLGIPTYASDSTAVTYTDAANLYIAGAPAAGANMSITNPWSLYVAAGATRLADVSSAAHTVSVDSNAAADTEFLVLNDTDQAAKTAHTSSSAISWNWLSDTTAAPDTWVAREAARIEVLGSDDWSDDLGGHAAADAYLRLQVAVNGAPAIAGLFAADETVLPAGIFLGSTAWDAGSTAFGLWVSNGIFLGPSDTIYWSNNAAPLSGAYVASLHSAGGVVYVNDGGADTGGDGTLVTGAASIRTHTLTGGAGVTESVDGELVTHAWKGVFGYSDIVTQCGAVTSCEYTVATLPAKSVVHSALLVVETQGAFGDTLGATVGVSGAAYDDWLSGNAGATLDLKAASGTVYGDADAERKNGAGVMPDADVLANYMPSYTATTAVVVEIEGNATALNDAGHTAGSYALIIHYTVLP